MRLAVILLAALLSGCTGGPTDGPLEPADAEAGDGAGLQQPLVVFDDRLQATGAGGATEATFEVPGGARTLRLHADDADDLAAGRFQLELESPAGRTWLVYGGYGYRSPVNDVLVGSSDETVETRAVPGTWTLRANTDGHVDLGVAVTVE